jgi:cephalosporin-C deacetylase-like acetyl esterase
MRNGILSLLILATGLGGQPLDDTAALNVEGDLAERAVAGIDSWLDRELAAAPSARVPGSRERLRTLIGAVDPRVPAPEIEFVVTTARGSQIGATNKYAAHKVRWPVFEAVYAEGLLLKPKQAPSCNVVALPDADQTPEDLAVDPIGRLAGYGCQVLVMTLIDRKDTWSANPAVNRYTNQPHREFIYRMAYEMGRHIIGYEVQKVLAAVDYFSRTAPSTPIHIYGRGEGGLVALYSAALDERISRTVVSGCFGPMETLWQQPIYRNVWGLLREFGGAEVARLILPRRLLIEAAHYPEVAGPPPEREPRRGAAPGALRAPALEEVRREAARAGPNVRVIDRPGDEIIAELLGRMPKELSEKLELGPVDAEDRMKRQFHELIAHTQRIVRASNGTRAAFQQKPPEQLRGHLHREVIGAMPPPTEPLRPATRLAYDMPLFRGYEAVIPVWPDVFAYGVLLVPKNLQAGERRPVVVAQHGLEGRPQFLVDPKEPRQAQAYQRYAARLAEEGFVVWTPQNPYIFGVRFRTLLRKAHPLKLSLFSFIIGQHSRALDWLVTLPFVDAKRIGFYGLSYGGKTAMRVPPLEPRYQAVICSGDFNEWIWKITSYDEPFSYMYTIEHDMLEFNLGNTFNYSDLARLIAPRPFMVERGHRDGVGIDEWVAYEFAKVRRYYSDIGQAGRAEIEFFPGPHQIWGQGTFHFLRRWLKGNSQP